WCSSIEANFIIASALPDIPLPSVYNQSTPKISDGLEAFMSGRSFEDFFGSGGRPSGRLWNPAADVYRTQDGWVVKIDLAGVKAEDIQVTLDGALLRLSGLRRDSFCGEGISHYQLEITYS